MILTVKHTRYDEEQERRELVGAAAVVRHGPLVSASTLVRQTQSLQDGMLSVDR